MKKTAVLLTGLVFMATAMAYAKDTIIIEGSTTVLPIAQKTAEDFMNANPDIVISVRGGGSGVGIASLIEGRCDIADSSRSMKDKEMKQAMDNGITPKPHVIAMDGIAVIVNKANSISGLDKETLKKIYTGKISHWSEVGGSGGSIVVVSRDTASGTFESFNELALNKEKVRPDALAQASNQAVATTVATTPGAIGYVGMGFLTPEVKAIPIDTIMPTNETVLSSEYPLSRPLFMYTAGTPQGAVAEFIDFVLSAAGQKIVGEEGYVGLK